MQEVGHRNWMQVAVAGEGEDMYWLVAEAE